jgi:hypothetical protein
LNNPSAIDFAGPQLFSIQIKGISTGCFTAIMSMKILNLPKHRKKKTCQRFSLGEERASQLIRLVNGQ